RLIRSLSCKVDGIADMFVRVRQGTFKTCPTDGGAPSPSAPVVLPAERGEAAQAPLGDEGGGSQRMSGPATSSPPNATTGRRSKRRNPKTDARNKWLYNLCRKGCKYISVMEKLKKVAKDRGWSILGSPQGVQQAVERYIERKKLRPLAP